jgi:hypothetical protein
MAANANLFANHDPFGQDDILSVKASRKSKTSHKAAASVSLA